MPTAAPAPVSVPRRRGPAFSTRMLLSQLAVVVFIVLLTAGIYSWFTYQQLAAEVGAKSLAVAQSLAVDATLRSAVTDESGTDDPPQAAVLVNGTVQKFAEDVRQRTGALFVVVTDKAGFRLAHPNPQELGKPVSTSPEEALAGREVTVQQVGTLGASVRSKVPVWSPDGGRVVGEVSVGYSMDDVFDSLRRSVVPIAGVALAALGIGLAASALLTRRLRALTLGLEPEEIGELVQDQEVVLHGVEEGVLGIAPDGRITVCNVKASRLLGLDAGAVGKTAVEAGLPAAVLGLMETPAVEGLPVQLVVDQAVLVVSARKVARGKADLGWVLMVRDQTDVQALSRQLDAVGALSTALRAQRHEFANRLHTVSGLLDIGDTGAAADYLRRTLETGPLKYPVQHADRLQDTYLQAFVGAKSAQAAERGVLLRIGEETAIRGQLTDPQNTTAVLGNLIDNAVSAAIRSGRDNPWVEIELLGDGADLHLTVSDSGDGIAENVDDPFAEGATASGGPEGGPVLGRGEGLGLTLSRQIARLGGGDVWIISSGRPGGPGAVFGARLPGVISPDPVRGPRRKVKNG